MVRMQRLTKDEPVQVVGQNISVESNHTYLTCEQQSPTNSPQQSDVREALTFL